jgi:thiamine biosynthesis lipoprotein
VAIGLPLLLLGLTASASAGLGQERTRPASGPEAPAAPAADRLARYEYAQVHMGVKTRLVVYAPDERTAADACRAAYARVAALEDVFSDYRPDSELTRLCAAPAGKPVKVSEDLFVVLERAQELAEATDGAFDVTVGPYVRLWREARKVGKLPPADALAEAKARVGWRHVRLDPAARTVTLAVAGMRLDLGGIAKGYAGDAAIAVLRERGVPRALFEAGGDIVAGEPPPGTDGWTVAAIDPDAPAGTRERKLTNAAMSTSGDTEQYVEIDGRRYSHVVDPRTGLGVTTRAMATVVAPTGFTTDPLATAACVLDRPAAERLVARYGATLYLRQSAD